MLRWLLLEPTIAYAHGQPWDLYMVSAAGGPTTQVTTLNEDEPTSCWLGNSTIVFMGASGLYRLQVNGQGKPMGAPIKLHEGARHGGLSWHGP